MASALHDQASGSSAAAGSAGRKLISQKYLLIKPPIGEGSFAKVYKGKNNETDEDVAIKEISWIKIRRRSPEFIARHNQNLKNEKDCLQSLDHPNIVKLLGGDLAQAMAKRRQEPVEEKLVRGLIRQLASGLQAIRKLNWVHRDLKPGNLLLSRTTLQEAATAEGGLKIGDFGFARDLAPEGMAETWVGSRLYMAPEILFNASGGYTAKADLWSVGCIMFELLYGRAPYGSRAKSTEVQLKEDIKNDSKYQRDPPVVISDPCRDLLDRLLQRNPAERLTYEEFFGHPWISNRPAQPAMGPAALQSSAAGVRVIAGRFVLAGGPLGEGSFATVFKGKNQETEEIVAIKEVSWIKIRRRSPEFIARHNQNLKNETDCLQALDHPNIVKLLAHENTPDYFYMVLEYCAGGDMALAMAKRRQEPVDEETGQGLIKQLAAGLQAVRKLNWVHRDLKPGNLLLSRATLQEAAKAEGGLKIGDFGFARDLAPESLAETWVGSRLYMAPEILFMRESGGYTAKADLWSVGCIMYELLYGRAPYGSRQGGTETDLKRDIKNDAKYKRDLPVEVSDACRDLYTRLLQPKPDNRLSYEDFFEHRWLKRPAAGAAGGAGAAAAGGGTAGPLRVVARKYVILPGHPLGEGTFATVYKGKIQGTEEGVAIKEVSWVKIRRRSPEFIARHNQNLKNETDCLRSLDHPNIVKLLGYENTSKHFYMVLELCAGGDLAMAMKKRGQEPLDEAVANGLVKQLADGLEAIRKLNWVHRDLKPGNLLLTRSTLQEAAEAQGGLKIGDFGFARDLAPESLAETWVGSRLYMAPEILFNASGGYTAKADLWSVGCIMYELLHGRAPFGSRAKSTEVHLKEDIRRNTRYTREPPVILSDACQDLLDRLLQENPVERASYGDLFRHRWLKSSGGSGGGGGSSGGTGADWAASACIGFGAAAASSVRGADAASQMRVQRNELLRSRLVIVSEALEGPPPPAGSGPGMYGGGQGGAERWQGQQGRTAGGFGGVLSGGGGGVAGGGRSSGSMLGAMHVHGGSSVEEGFEMIGDSNLDPIMVDSPGDCCPSGRREAAQIIESLPAEVASLASEVEWLRRDVLACTHAVVQLADEELEAPANPRPAYGLALYLWSVRLLHRCLAQLHHVENQYGHVFPPALVTAWKESLHERLSDDFNRAKGALRMCLLSSAAAGTPWATADGQISPAALSTPAAPAPQRLAYGAALRAGRRAATGELLVPLPWHKARGYYLQGLVLLCALLLDCGGSEGGGGEEAKVVESYAGMFARRILSESDVPQAMTGQECIDLLRRCGQPGRLRSDLPPPSDYSALR